MDINTIIQCDFYEAQGWEFISSVVNLITEFIKDLCSGINCLIYKESMWGS